ncbi:hypothetical protein B0A52_04012 [Exophiala mesophila]|uniref:BZIP domain-containing protein n=1 Tax=Exophiala mesophila TaxID=212818 RepID=A0A438NAH6_EXOME|nr:hypothetical protein B0A52_04012 [Exophiala mesophila]
MAAPHPYNGPDSNMVPTVSSRRLKKREIDRRCQRQARERTKSRIAYLEGLVEDFRRQDSSGQVATLMRQLHEVEAERDAMSKTLKDIQKAMDIIKPINSHLPPPPRDLPFHDQAHSVYEAIEEEEDQKPSIQSLSRDLSSTTSQPTRLDHQSDSGEPSSFELANFDPTPPAIDQSPEALLRVDDQSPRSTSQTVKSVTELDISPSNYANSWAHSGRDCTCNQGHGDDRVPGQKAAWRGSYWRYANEVLGERFDWNNLVHPTSDAVSHDVPVRAVLEGWESVEKRGPLHPTWHVLKRIDQILFHRCPPAERLAILRAMHTLLQFHLETSSERYSRLPPWYLRRPSQKIAHSYAIDFFAWPGIRERFIFSEHDYCANEFWDLFATSLHIMWPFEFRDCYTREVDTGLYKISPQFEHRLRDIKCWTMGPDMFGRFPELQNDMPAFNTIPPNMTNKRPLRMIEASQSPTQPQEEKTVQKKKNKSQVKSASRIQNHIPEPVQRPQTHQYNFQPPLQQVTRPPNLFQFNCGDFAPVSTLDAFAYGAINEADFAAMYHPEDLEGYPNITF